MSKVEQQALMDGLRCVRQIHAYKVQGPMISTLLVFTICAFGVGMPILICVLVVISRFLHGLGF